LAVDGSKIRVREQLPFYIKKVLEMRTGFLLSQE
jgi:hypothetical protein